MDRESWQAVQSMASQRVATYTFTYATLHGLNVSHIHWLQWSLLITTFSYKGLMQWIIPPPKWDCQPKYFCNFWSVCVLVVRSYLTLRDPMGYNPPGSSVHGILQARILKWIAIPFSRGSSQPRDWIQLSHIADRFFTIWATREVHLAPQMITNIYIYV